MVDPSGTSSLVERVMTRNQEAFQAGYYNTADDLLAAALPVGAADPHHCLTVQILTEAQ